MYLAILLILATEPAPQITLPALPRQCTLPALVTQCSLPARPLQDGCPCGDNCACGNCQCGTRKAAPQDAWKPEGDGWQWDEGRQVWWREIPRSAQPQPIYAPTHSLYAPRIFRAGGSC